MNQKILHTKRWSINFWRIGGFLRFLLFFNGFSSTQRWSSNMVVPLWSKAPSAPFATWPLWRPWAWNRQLGWPGVDILGAKTIGFCKFVKKTYTKKNKTWDLIWTHFCNFGASYIYMCICIYTYVCIYVYIDTLHVVHIYGWITSRRNGTCARNFGRFGSRNLILEIRVWKSRLMNLVNDVLKFTLMLNHRYIYLYMSYIYI